MVAVHEIKQALELPDFDAVAAHRGMAPVPRTLVRPPEKKGSPNTGAVLLLLFDRGGTLHVLLTRRQDTLTMHPGQISFPGGRRKSDEPLTATALRETREEIGIPPESLSLLGALAPVYIPPSDFIVHPFVAGHIGRPVLSLDFQEVAEILEVELESLYSPARRGKEHRLRGTSDLIVPFFLVSGHKVWGATAMILNELLERLQTLRNTAPI